MTEDEAKTKWCPQTQFDPQRTPQGFHPSQTCLGSACMAWRWIEGSDDVGGFKRVDPEDSRKLGCCGLASHEGQHQ